MTHEKKSLPRSERQLTVYTKHVPRAWHQYAVVPEIRLCGKWLHDAGFACGDAVTVRCFGNKLEIFLKEGREGLEGQGGCVDSVG